MRMIDMGKYILMKNAKSITTVVVSVLVIIGIIVGIKHITSAKDEPTTASSSATETKTDKVSGTSTTQTETEAKTTTLPESTTAKPKPTYKRTEPSKVTTTKKKSVSKETMTYREMDYSCFDDCAFIGNSRVLDLKNYGLAENVYASVGLNVNTVFTVKASGSDVPIIDELNGKHFSKVFIMFGDNECGWPNTSVFISKYANIIDAVRERVPEAEIYIQSVLPISRAADARNEYGCNMQAINKINDALKQLAADEGVHYINPAAAMTDSEGFLPDEASSDGVHLKKKYCRIWMNYLADNM